MSTAGRVKGLKPKLFLFAAFARGIVLTGCSAATPAPTPIVVVVPATPVVVVVTATPEPTVPPTPTAPPVPLSPTPSPPPQPAEASPTESERPQLLPSEVRAVVDLITTYYGHLGRRDFRSAYGVLNPEEQRQTDFQTYVRPYDGLQSLSLDRVEIADNGPGWVEADAFTTVVYHPGPGVSKPLVRGSGGG